MTPYEELDNPTAQHADCEAVGRRLEQAARRAVAPAPSIHYDEFPREVPKRDIQVSEAAQRLAAALYTD
jgi:hypothetical protein